MLEKLIARIKNYIFNHFFFKNHYGIGSGAWILYNFDVKSWEFISKRVNCGYILTKSINKVNFKRQLTDYQNLNWTFEIESEILNDKWKNEIELKGTLTKDTEIIATISMTYCEAFSIHKNKK